MVGKGLGQRRPTVADRTKLALQRRGYVRTNAVDMYVQLVLGSPEGGIDRQTDRLARQWVPRRLLGEAAFAPSVPKVIGCVGREQQVAFNPRHPRGRDHQVLRRP